MAENEDTELRDLVVEALEKNGSLAKIRALLRANVFLAFEDDCQKLKHNVILDNILQTPEGVLALSLVHEFLEFCNLKNTLFVYTSESRQGKGYTYEGAKLLAQKFKGFRYDPSKQPLLISILNNLSVNRQYTHDPTCKANKDEQNSTYIVHEDSSNVSSQSTSQSDHSSDEKQKLHLRLPLDNSDTDTSSDSARDKIKSEYIPNKNIVIKDESEDDNNSQHSISDLQYESSVDKKIPDTNIDFVAVNKPKLTSIQQSEENTSQLSDNLINTIGVPYQDTMPIHMSNIQAFSVSDKLHSTTTSDSISSNVSSISHSQKLPMKDKNMSENIDYTYDFSSSLNSKRNDTEVEIEQSLNSKDILNKNSNKCLPPDSPHQNSQSSQSSVSISDVADLIELSEANSPRKLNQEENKKAILDTSESQKSFKHTNKNEPNESGDFSDSSIPSLSNLSIDIRSD